MYKVSFHVLESILNSLEQSNKVLKKLSENNKSLDIQKSIIENEKQIEFIKLNYSLNG